MKKHNLLYLLGLASLPIIIAGLFVLFINIQAYFRYDQSFFTARYQALYSNPSAVSAALEKAIRTNDLALYAELTGLRSKPRSIKYDPNMRLATLLEVSDNGYFKYLYFDVRTYERATYFIKKVMDRWVVVPQNAYYYYDSGQWLVVFTPLTLIWWGALIVCTLVLTVYRYAAKIREDLFKGRT